MGDILQDIEYLIFNTDHRLNYNLHCDAVPLGN